MKELPEETLEELSAPSDAFRIALPNFEGPLDLLLHLIREHKVDILDIPIALITEKYLESLEKMREVNLDIAGEFLVMASTLMHLKSRLLLPKEDVVLSDDGTETALDPRAELVHRLLEYQKYKDAAQQLAQNDLLDREVFVRRVSVDRVPFDPEEIGLKELSVYKLIEALDRVLKALEPKLQHEVVRDRLSLSDAIHRLADRLRDGARVSFFALFEGVKTRSQLVITFLAILEMAKLKLIRVFQLEGEDDILLSAKGEALSSMASAAGASAPQELDNEYQ